jgi:TetR/AcrR family transcriptional regulator, transcriptional repressor of aconitase
MKIKASNKPGRPSGDHGKRQREIADTLLKVIGTHGLDKASMRLVARAANCTTGVLSHYFSSKEDLVCSAVDLLFDWAERRAESAAKGGDSVKALKVAVGISDSDEQAPFDFWAVWLQVLAKTKQNRRLSNIVRRRHGRFRDLLTRIVKEGQERKQIRADIQADLLADLINALSDGLGLMAPIEAERLTKERLTQMMNLSIDFLRQTLPRY